MIVVVIIGILVAIAIPRFTNITIAAKEAEAIPILRQLHTLQERYYQAHDTYASDFSLLEGGVNNFEHAKYYKFSLTTEPDGSEYVACATPREGVEGLRSFSITTDQTIIEDGC